MFVIASCFDDNSILDLQTAQDGKRIVCCVGSSGKTDPSPAQNDHKELMEIFGLNWSVVSWILLDSREV